MPHHDTPDIIQRLKRAEGHLRTVIVMMQEERNCLDIAQQLHAVEKAITNAKKILIHDHIRSCIETSADNGSKEVPIVDPIREFKELIKYL